MGERSADSLAQELADRFPAVAILRALDKAAPGFSSRWLKPIDTNPDTQPPAVGVDVSDEMVERACAEWWGSDWGTWRDYQAEMKRAKARRILTAALRTGGGADHG